MKKIGSLIAVLCLCELLFTTCKKDSPSPQVKTNDSITAQIPVNKGTIGVVIDVRSINKKGYIPVTAELTYSGNYSGFSRNISIDQSTNTATFRIRVDSITDDQLSAFNKGVDATIKIFDLNSNQLALVHEPKLAVDATNTPYVINTALPPKLPAPKFNANMPYFIQSEKSMKVITLINSSGAVGAGVLEPADYDITNGNNQKFYLKNVPGEGDSTVYIVSYNGYILMKDFTGELNESSTAFSSGGLNDAAKFIVRVDTAGWVKIHWKNGQFLKEYEVDFGLSRFIEGSGNSDFTEFRLLNGDITYSITDQGTDYSQPLLPAAKLEFAYKATLRNCSQANLSETIGRTESRTQSITNSTEESLSLFSSNEESVQVSAGVAVDATFFGAGATYNFDVTGGYTYTTSTTQTKTNYW